MRAGLAIALVFMLAHPADSGAVLCVNGDDHHTCQQPVSSGKHKSDQQWLLPVTVIIAAVVAVWYWITSERSEPPPAKVDPEPLNVAPPRQVESTWAR